MLVERLARVAGHEKPRTVDPADGINRIAEALVGPNRSERKHGSAVVTVHHLAGKDRVRNDAKLVVGYAERRQRTAPGLAVHDDALEA